MVWPWTSPNDPWVIGRLVQAPPMRISYLDPLHLARSGLITANVCKALCSLHRSSPLPEREATHTCLCTVAHDVQPRAPLREGSPTAEHTSQRRSLHRRTLRCLLRDCRCPSEPQVSTASLAGLHLLKRGPQNKGWLRLPGELKAPAPPPRRSDVRL